MATTRPAATETELDIPIRTGITPPWVVKQRGKPRILSTNLQPNTRELNINSSHQITGETIFSPSHALNGPMLTGAATIKPRASEGPTTTTIRLPRTTIHQTTGRPTARIELL